MAKDLWQQRWDEGRIGFHLDQFHPWLDQYWAEITDQSHDRVLVPLCGKSLDLRYLAVGGHPVVGVDIVPDAVEQFFAEWSVDPTVAAGPGYRRFNGNRVSLYAGDFFGVEPEEGLCDLWYDRAALVALPPSARPAYVERLLALTSATASGLLITFDYPADEMEGPPFALPDEEVAALFADSCTVERLAHEDLTADDGRDLSRCSRSAFRLRRR
ncbi:MAG: thiopurine S-methyltransferase [Myxococcales bacterium]|nr:thiopurine S-methyltransferase [Myxococcales bacterium]